MLRSVNRTRSVSQKKKAPSYKGFRPASANSSRAMRANQSTGTMHERLIERHLTGQAIGFRKHFKGLVGRPDFVFADARVVVFCDGDFWHGRHWRKLRRQLAFRANASYWIAKIAANRRRDLATTTVLQAEGWLVLRYWETDILDNPARIAKQIVTAVQGARARAPATGGRRLSGRRTPPKAARLQTTGK